MVLGRQLGAPAILDDDGLVRFDDDRRPGDALAGPDRFAPDDRRHRAIRPCENSRVRSAIAGSPASSATEASSNCAPPPTASTSTASTTSALVVVDEAEARLVRGLEGLLHRSACPGRRSRSAPCRCRHSGYGLWYGWRSRPRPHPAPRPPNASRQRAARPRPRSLLSPRRRAGHPAPPCRVDADLGEAHAIGRQQPGQRMQQHRLDAERIGDEAGMLAAGAAEGVQRIAGDVVAALDRDLLDRLGHVGDRDLDEAVRDLLGRAAVADLAPQASQTWPAPSRRRAAASCFGPKIAGK